MYFAYDTPDDYEPLVEAGKLLRDGGFNARGHVASAYVLIGYPKDTFQKAEKRLMQTIEAGFQPYAMLWKDKAGTVDEKWQPFQREWCRPMIAGKKFTDYWTAREECCELVKMKWGWRTMNYDKLPTEASDGRKQKAGISCGGGVTFLDEDCKYHVECENCGTLVSFKTTSLDMAIKLWNDMPDAIGVREEGSVVMLCNRRHRRPGYRTSP